MNYPYFYLDSKVTTQRFDAKSLQNDFPILRKTVRGKKLVYLDNAATSQKPYAVIDAIRQHYLETNANVHRGVHWLSEKATEAYESARQKMQQFVHAASAKEIIFVRGVTEGINLVAQTWGKKNLGKGDEILVTEMEHHSNLVPWQMLCEQTGATLQAVHINLQGELQMAEFDQLLSAKTKLVAVAHISNALGTINPVNEIIERAHQVGALVLVDGAQAAPHRKIDVQALECDFYVLSGHKMYGPSGIGILYGKQDLLQVMPPYQGGGEMITSVSLSRTTYANPPYRFEAGTPNIEGAIGIGAAADYLTRLDLNVIESYEKQLLEYGTRRLQDIEGLQIIGTALNKAGILSFVFHDIHPHDIGTILDQQGIAVRTGHHCAMPVMERFNLPATTRASLALYNTKEDIDALVTGLRKVREVFQ
jgi:cysteine desulfurase/selenocysteine lyase